jgi:hypothetical protein
MDFHARALLQRRGGLEIGRGNVKEISLYKFRIFKFRLSDILIYAGCCIEFLMIGKHGHTIFCNL